MRLLSCVVGLAVTSGLFCLRAQGAPPALASQDVQTFVRQALEDRIAARDVPDLDFRRHSRTLFLRSDVPRTNVLLGDEALPHVPDFSVVLRTLPDLQAEADRTGRASDMFLVVSSVGVAGDVGFIELGTDVVAPARVGKLCCCTGNGRFTRTGSRWTFEKWLSTVCS